VIKDENGDVIANPQDESEDGSEEGDEDESVWGGFSDDELHDTVINIDGIEIVDVIDHLSAEEEEENELFFPNRLDDLVLQDVRKATEKNRLRIASVSNKRRPRKVYNIGDLALFLLPRNKGISKVDGKRIMCKIISKSEGKPPFYKIQTKFGRYTNQVPTNKLNEVQIDAYTKEEVLERLGNNTTLLSQAASLRAVTIRDYVSITCQCKVRCTTNCTSRKANV